MNTYVKYIKYKRYTDEKMVLTTKVSRVYDPYIDRSRKDEHTIHSAVCSIHRAHSALLDILACNEWKYFITLTFDNLDYYILSSVASGITRYTDLYRNVCDLMNNKSFLTDEYFRMRLERLYRNRYIDKKTMSLTEKGKRNCVDKYDDDKCRRLFIKWRKSMRKKFPSMYYVAVPEYHGKGGIHYHIVVSGVSPDELELVDSGRVYHNGSCWRRQDFFAKGFKVDPKTGDGVTVFNILGWEDGFSTATEVRCSDAVVHYVSKYLSKSKIDPRFYCKKRFYTSHNIRRPEIITDEMPPAYDLPLEYGASLCFRDDQKEYSVYEGAEDVIRARLQGLLPMPRLPF